uniref:Putative secreted protein n=1 Tax=Amblyomma triste TaxID=251400 RepID=A0A023G5A6_AMBTT
MGLSKRLNLLIISVVALASMMTVPCIRGQDCQQSPKDCSATKILSDFPLLYDQATSISNNPTYCERYERTSLSEDGTIANYDASYIYYSGDGTLITDKCTYVAVSNTLIDMTCKNFSDIVYPFTLDFVSETNCFVGHTYLDENTKIQYYYLFINPYSDDESYEPCFSWLNGYSSGNVYSIHDEEKCKSVPRKP